MRAMVLEAPAAVETNPLRERDVPRVSPGAGQVSVAVRCCGVCHTDLHEAEGDLRLPRLPLIPGHQVVGVVEATGAGVRKLREGDRVGVPWLYSTCGHCCYCVRGQENLCENACFTGMHVDGGYAENMLVEEGSAYAVPEKFTDVQIAPLLCAGVIGYRAYCLSGVHRGERLGLYGFGGSAHIVLQFAKYLGCEVYVYTRGAEHRELALRLGAAWAGQSGESAPAPLDGAILFAPAGALVLDALRALRRGGTVALAGITMSDIPQLPYRLLYQERTLRSVANSTHQDVREFLDLAADVPVCAATTVFPLVQANLALQQLKTSRIQGAAVLTLG